MKAGPANQRKEPQPLGKNPGQSFPLLGLDPAQSQAEMTILSEEAHLKIDPARLQNGDKWFPVVSEGGKGQI